MSSAALFSWLQGARFYVQLHAEAVALVPVEEAPRRGGAWPRRWLDVGCGPGLVTRLAAARGFAARGCDASIAMVKAARRNASGIDATQYCVGTLESLVGARVSAEVVSAASLLAVLPDRAAALAALWSLVAPGGHLLVVETTPEMRVARAVRHLAGRRAVGLLLWAAARRGRSAAPMVDGFRPAALASVRYRSIASGLAGAWLFTRARLEHKEES